MDRTSASEPHNHNVANKTVRVRFNMTRQELDAIVIASTPINKAFVKLEIENTTYQGFVTCKLTPSIGRYLVEGELSEAKIA